MNRATVLTGALFAAIGCWLTLAAAPTVAAGALPTLTLTVTKNNVAVGGEKVSGAVNIAATVSGEASDNPALILLKPGVTPGAFRKVVEKLGGSLDAIDAYATAVYDSQDAPAGQTTTTEAVLPAGNYVAVNNGNAFTPFKITQSPHPATLPAPQATVRSIEFGFRGASTLREGELVRFENDGYLIHMFQAAKTASFATANKAAALLLAGKANEAKKYAIAPLTTLAGPLSSGQAQQSVITAPPGVYLMFCSMETQDGREHFQLGMVRTIKVVK
jgi:hypothetical protein